VFGHRLPCALQVPATRLADASDVARDHAFESQLRSARCSCGPIASANPSVDEEPRRPEATRRRSSVWECPCRDAYGFIRASATASSTRYKPLRSTGRRAS